jgi:hypothetical protein
MVFETLTVLKEEGVLFAEIAAPPAAMTRMRRGGQHPVPVRIYYWSEGWFETIEAVNFAAAEELVEKINGKKSAGRHAYIPAVASRLLPSTTPSGNWRIGTDDRDPV